MTDIIRGATESPVSTETLISYIEQLDFIKAVFYSGYPILSSQSEKSSIDGLLISKEHGLIIFDIVEGSVPKDRQATRDSLYNSLYSRLIGYNQLTKKRGELYLNIFVLTFAPAYPQTVDSGNPELINRKDNLINFLKKNKKEDITDETYRMYIEAIQAITKLKQRPLRNVINNTSKGAKLNKLEESISNLDKQQGKAVIETTNGIQRIRGLAGSGKTIVLALKAAYLHSKYPEWNIGVTFYTRSLKDQFREFITKFTIEHKNEEPDWNKVKIQQAWGGPSEKGFYYDFCSLNNVEYYDFQQAKAKFGGSTKLLDEICKEALQQVQNPKEIYDLILIDEAQDFSENFLRLIYSLLRSHDPDNKKNKRLIYAYDELQNLNRTILRSPKEIFGNDIDFKNEPKKPLQDIVLSKCYRNSAPVLVTAHGLGFGIYRKEGLVTMFEEKEIWGDVGYKIENGELDYGKEVTLKRDSETSPEYYKDVDSIDELLKFMVFSNKKEQIKWVVNEIETNLKNDELTYKDIIVIHPDAKTAKNELGLLRKELFEKGITSHLAGVTTSPDNFYIEDSIACTSIFRAKGNEAPMIYIINSDYCFSGYELITKRNILFTAITRSKCWVRICGVGEAVKGLEEEFKQIRQNKFRLKFTYPTIEELKNLNVIHRDLSSEEKKNIRDGNKELKGLVEKLANNSIKIEDLTKEQLDLLRNLLNVNQ